MQLIEGKAIKVDEAKPRRSRHLLDSLSAERVSGNRLRPGAASRVTTTTSLAARTWVLVSPYAVIVSALGRPGLVAERLGAIKDAKVIDRERSLGD